MLLLPSRVLNRRSSPGPIAGGGWLRREPRVRRKVRCQVHPQGDARVAGWYVGPRLGDVSNIVVLTKDAVGLPTTRDWLLPCAERAPLPVDTWYAYLPAIGPYCEGAEDPKSEHLSRPPGYARPTAERYRILMKGSSVRANKRSAVVATVSPRPDLGRADSTNRCRPPRWRRGSKFVPIRIVPIAWARLDPLLRPPLGPANGKWTRAAPASPICSGPGHPAGNLLGRPPLLQFGLPNAPQPPVPHSSTSFDRQRPRMPPVTNPTTPRVLLGSRTGDRWVRRPIA